MEEAPVTAATGALGPVVAKLRALLRWRHGEYQLRRGTEKDLKVIKSKLKSIHSILWVIWEREHLDAAGKELRMEAWRLADDMNDAIDDFILSMKRSNDGKRFVQAKIQPSRPFKDLKRRANDVSERCRKKWKMMETAQTAIVSSLFSRTKATVDDSGLANRLRVFDPYVHKDVSELVDMEEPRDKFIKHLVGEEESTPRLKMASILGAAGVGKTTLARLVYEAIEDKFEARAFVSVTSSHNMTEVLARIYQHVQGPAHTTVVPLAATKSVTAEEHLIDVILNFLKDKRYLVIIDDIWHCGEWDTIKKSLPDNNLFSRIVTTSRVTAITDKWREDFGALVYRIGYSDFCNKMIDMNANMVGECFDRDHPIVKMCDGMPLAVACMFSALAKERERQEQQRLWLCKETRELQDRIEEQVKRNGIQNTSGFEALVESLELGYNDLPHHMLKTCLLYCSIKRHAFTRGELVRQWIAQGFVCKEEVAKDYFDELESSGFLESYSNRYKMHLMMRNYLRQKLREDNFITCTSDGVPSYPVGRLCIDYWPSSDSVDDTLSGIDWHHIRSLVVLQGAERVPYKHFQNLRVLDGRCNENQHLKYMCRLLRLRHLLLSGGSKDGRRGINEMPAEIARLQYLETLEVRETGIRRLPAEIGDLRQLKTLDVSWNRELAELPREIARLQYLETLEVRETGIRRLPAEIGDLRQLKTLDVSWNRELAELPREIGNLQHLEALRLRGTNVRKIPREIGRLKELKHLDAEIAILPFGAGQLPKLEGLPKCFRRAWKNSDLMSSLAGEILSFEKTGQIGDGGLVVGTKHVHIPQWIKEHFNNIASLDIRICTLEERDLKILREMPYLEDLALRFEAVPVPREPIAISGAGFAKLKLLTVDSRVPRVTFQEGAMPRLKYLTFEFQFYGGVPNTDPVGINHLVDLLRVDFCCSEWYRGDSPCISATFDVMRKEAQEHPNWIQIQIRLVVGGQVRLAFPEADISESYLAFPEADISESSQGH